MRLFNLFILLLSLIYIGCSSGLRTGLDIWNLNRTDTVSIDWRASDIFTADPYKPHEDNMGLEWYQYSYNDYWLPLRFLPDKDWGCDECDRYYRGYFYVSSVKTFGKYYLLNIKSDDGIWIYINGKYLGHLGGNIHNPGSINMGWKYYKNDQNVSPININNFLIRGKNVIAVRVSEWEYGEYFDCLLIRQPK